MRYRLMAQIYIWSNSMNTFTVRDLREHAGKLIRGAENGELSVITEHGTPVFIAVPFDETLLREGVGMALAIKLFDEESISLSRAAKLAGLSVSEMIDMLGRHSVAVIRSTEEELERELADFS
jgi:antitoxin (DNA-binding transcriptional repressor) of toxin-antitoxin stability system